MLRFVVAGVDHTPSPLSTPGRDNALMFDDMAGFAVRNSAVSGCAVPQYQADDDDKFNCTARDERTECNLDGLKHCYNSVLSTPVNRTFYLSLNRVVRTIPSDEIIDTAWYTDYFRSCQRVYNCCGDGTWQNIINEKHRFAHFVWGNSTYLYTTDFRTMVSALSAVNLIGTNHR